MAVDDGDFDNLGFAGDPCGLGIKDYVIRAGPPGDILQSLLWLSVPSSLHTTAISVSACCESGDYPSQL